MVGKTSSFTNRKHYRLALADTYLDLGQETKIMGILNLTPDSFSADGILNKDDYVSYAKREAERFIGQGADIIDIGGESARPGSKPISVQEELDRIIPTVKAVVSLNKAYVSVDTYKPLVARYALDCGATIINMIRGTRIDKAFLKTVSRYKALIVLMHMQGIPQTMQMNIRYDNVIFDIIEELKMSIDMCLDNGIDRERIIVDPGIGFGKTVEHNLQIIKGLRFFDSLMCPVLIGTSRKSFIGKVLDQSVDKRLLGGLATIGVSILNGVHIVRTHDVSQTKEFVTMMDSILNV